MYDLIWSPGSLVWEVDGVTTCTVSQSYVPSAPMYLKIDMFFMGSVNNSSLPWTTQVDYVQVSQNGSNIFYDDFNGPPPPAITSPTSAVGTIGSPFSYQITAINSPTSYGANGLPSGLSVNAATGLISGTPSVSGTFSVTLTATNSSGMGSATLTLTINSGGPAVAFVQAASSASSGGGSSWSVSFPANTTTGDVIWVGFDFSNSSTAAVTDSQGNAFKEVGSQLTSPGGTLSRVYYAPNIIGGPDTVTITLSANSEIEAYITEYSGANPSNPIDAQAGSSGSAGPVSSGNATTSVAGDLIYGYCVADWTCTAGPGFTARSTLHNNLIEDMSAGSPGSSNNGWTIQMVALKPGSSTVGAPAITSSTSASGTVGTAFFLPDHRHQLAHQF